MAFRQATGICTDSAATLSVSSASKDYPLIEVGEFELNRNPENFFAEVEQSAFNPASVVPGVSFSPDKMLQGRLFSYGDAQRYRLGVNHNLIPVMNQMTRVNGLSNLTTVSPRWTYKARRPIGTSAKTQITSRNPENFSAS